MPRIMRQAALNIPVLQYDETMVFPTEEKKQQRTKDAKTQLFADVIIQQAQLKATGILENAKLESEKIIQEARIQIFEELEQRRKETFDKAYTQGFSKGEADGFEQGQAGGRQVYAEKLQAESHEMVTQLEKALAAIETYREELKAANRKIVIDLVRMIGYKVLSEKLEENDAMLVQLLNNALKGQERCHSLRIKCGEEYFAGLSCHNEEIAQLLAGVCEKIVIEETPGLQSKKCLVECDDTTLDISLDVQLDNAAKILATQID